MSAALLGTASVSGQIMYTDLEPDGIINAGEAINIDLNGDGINDYSPGVASAGTSTLIQPKCVSPSKFKDTPI